MSNKYWITQEEKKYCKMLALLKELELGIIPRELYNKSLNSGSDPFKDLSEKEKRKLKRKFRKLKRRIKKQISHNGYIASNNKIRSLIFSQLMEESK